MQMSLSEDITTTALIIIHATGKTANGKIYCGGCYTNGGTNIPCYWIDGKCIELPYTTGGIVFSMTIYNGDIYLTGRNNNNYNTLWKDSSLLWGDDSLANGCGYGGVMVYDNDIYYGKSL